ncbi:hypothetical protein [Microbacterium lacticum]
MRLRTAREDHDAAPWYRRFATGRAVRDAEHELAEVRSAEPAAGASARVSWLE